MWSRLRWLLGLFPWRMLVVGTMPCSVYSLFLAAQCRGLLGQHHLGSKSTGHCSLRCSRKKPPLQCSAPSWRPPPLLGTGHCQIDVAKLTGGRSDGRSSVCCHRRCVLPGLVSSGGMRVEGGHSRSICLSTRRSFVPARSCVVHIGWVSRCSCLCFSSAARRRQCAFRGCSCSTHRQPWKLRPGCRGKHRRQCRWQRCDQGAMRSRQKCVGSQSCAGRHEPRSCISECLQGLCLGQ